MRQWETPINFSLSQAVAPGSHWRTSDCSKRRKISPNVGTTAFYRLWAMICLTLKYFIGNWLLLSPARDSRHLYTTSHQALEPLRFDEGLFDLSADAYRQGRPPGSQRRDRSVLPLVQAQSPQWPPAETPNDRN